MALIGTRLKILRACTGITQGALAKKSGLSKGHLSQIESGTRMLSEKTMRKICKVLEVSPNVFEERAKLFLEVMRWGESIDCVTIKDPPLLYERW